MLPQIDKCDNCKGNTFIVDPSALKKLNHIEHLQFQESIQLINCYHYYEYIHNESRINLHKINKC